MKNRSTKAARLTLSCALSALVLAPAAGADLSVGVADDHAKESPAVAETFYDTMKDVGLKENRITILWDASRPTTIDHRDPVAHAIEVAAADGVRVTLALYPDRARSITESSSRAGDFAAWAALVARTFPQVKDFIVGNEPNKSRFWQPQFNPNGKAAACLAYESLLAASYDALKGVDRSIIGHRRRAGPAWHGQPARSRQPLDLAGALHPRPRPRVPGQQADEADHGRAQLPPAPEPRDRQARDGLPLAQRRHPEPRADQAGGLGRLQRTGQPTFEEAGMPQGPVRTLKLRLNEVGWQVGILPDKRGAYFGKESVVTTDEGNQAAIYGNLIPLLACDPAVKSALFFNLVDEANLDRWQSGLMRADWSPRPSYAIVKGSILAGQTRCGGRPVRWRHAVKPVGVKFGFLGGSRPRSDRNKAWSFVAGTEEGTLYTAALFKVRRPGKVSGALQARFTRALRTSRVPGATLKASGRLVGGWDKVITFRSKRLKPGFYVYAARIVAEMNLTRQATYVGVPFAVRPR